MFYMSNSHELLFPSFIATTDKSAASYKEAQDKGKLFSMACHMYNYYPNYSASIILSILKVV